MSNNHSMLMQKLSVGWGEGNKEALLSAYNETCRFEDKALGLVHHNLAGIEEVFDYSFTIFPDFKVVYGCSVVGEDFASAEWVYTGSFCGELEGKHYHRVPVSIEGISFMELVDGKISRNSDYWNLASLMQQLNANT